MTRPDQHPILHHAWDALAVLLVIVAIICGLCLFVEYGQLTPVSRLALAGIIAACIGVVIGKRVLARRK